MGVIPFVILFHYHRHDVPDSARLSNVFVLVLALNIIEPSLLKEYPQGIYINGTTGWMLAALTMLVGWNASTVKKGTYIMSGMGWAYVSAYFFWHICLFYAQEYQLNTPGATFVGNYFVFDCVLCGFAVVMCVFSEYGPNSFAQHRAYSLSIKLTMNALWTSNRTPDQFVRSFFVDITFDPVTHFWFQIFAFILVWFGLYYAVKARYTQQLANNQNVWAGELKSCSVEAGKKASNAKASTNTETLAPEEGNEAVSEEVSTTCNSDFGDDPANHDLEAC